MEKDFFREITPVSLVEALNMKYSEENCIVDDFAHIHLTSRVKQKTRGQGKKNLCLFVHSTFYLFSGELSKSRDDFANYC